MRKPGIKRNTRSGAWVAVAFVIGILIALPSTTQAAMCRVQCTNGESGAGGERATCGTGSCFDLCQTQCAGTKGGCARWACDGGASSPTALPTTNCTLTALTTRTGLTGALPEIQSRISSLRRPTGAWSCEQTSFDESRCIRGGCGTTRNTYCCAPLACAQVAVQVGRQSSQAVEEIERSTGIASSLWTCQTTAHVEGRCVPFGCPRLNGRQCCVPGTGTETSREGSTEQGSFASDASSAGSTASTTSTSCGVIAARNDAARVREVEQASNTRSDQWTCQRVQTGSERVRSNCVTGACPGCPADVRCCIPGIGTAYERACVEQESGSVAGGGTGSRGSRSSGVRLFSLPACTQEGNCQISDIVQTGVSFANFLIALSGAVFMAILVWGGFLYIFWAHDSGKVTEAKTMIINATTAMLIILASSALIRFVRATLVPDRCFEEMGAAYSCQETGSFSASDRRAHNCQQGKCPGAAAIQCCLLEPATQNAQTESSTTPSTSTPETPGSTPPASAGPGT